MALMDDQKADAATALPGLYGTPTPEDEMLDGRV
jgi:hypothetical protein